MEKKIRRQFNSVGSPIASLGTNKKKIIFTPKCYFLQGTRKNLHRKPSSIFNLVSYSSGLFLILEDTFYFFCKFLCRYECDKPVTILFAVSVYREGIRRFLKLLADLFSVLNFGTLIDVRRKVNSNILKRI